MKVYFSSYNINTALPTVLFQSLAVDKVSSIDRDRRGNAGDKSAMWRDDFHEARVPTYLSPTCRFARKEQPRCALRAELTTVLARTPEADIKHSARLWDRRDTGERTDTSTKDPPHSCNTIRKPSEQVSTRFPETVAIVCLA